MTIRDRLERWIDGHFDELLSELADLVRIPSVATYDDPDTPCTAPVSSIWSSTALADSMAMAR